MKCRHDAGMAFRDLCDDCREAVGRPRNPDPPTLANAAESACRWLLTASQNATGHTANRHREEGERLDAALAADRERREGKSDALQTAITYLRAYGEGRATTATGRSTRALIERWRR